MKPKNWCVRKISKVRNSKSPLIKEIIARKLTQRYPNLSIYSIIYLTEGIMDNQISIESLCNNLDRLVQDDRIACVFRCTVGNLPLPEIFRILAKCLAEPEPLPCFASEFGDKIYQCILQCWQKK